MNKSVSSHWAIIIVLIVAAAAGVYVWMEGNAVGSANSNPVARKMVAVNQKTNKCSAHAYTGKADVHVWQTQKNGQNVLEVVPADVSKLPNGKCTEFKLADMTPIIQKKLVSSSEKNPVEVTITGFMTRCDNRVAVAVMDYKQSVFKPYL